MKNQTKRRRKIYTAEFYRGNHIAFFFALLSTALISLLDLAIAWLMQQMIDAVSGVEGTYSLAQLTAFTAIIIALIVAIKGINYFSKPGFVKKAMLQYKNTAFAKLTRKSIHSFNQESTANYLSALTNGVSAIESGYVELMFDLLFELVLLIGAILMMLWYSPLLTLVAIGFFLLPIAVSLITGKRMEKAELKISEKNEAFLVFPKDSLAGFPVIKSFKAEKSTENLFQKENESLEWEKWERGKIIAAQFGTFLVGMALAFSGAGITPGILLIFVDLTGNVIRPIAALPDYLAKRKAAAALIDKLAAALESNVRDEGEDIPARLTDAIRLQNVCFGYDQEEILHHISACFEAGKSYAIVGISGSGKSTLLEATAPIPARSPMTATNCGRSAARRCMIWCLWSGRMCSFSTPPSGTISPWSRSFPKRGSTGPSNCPACPRSSPSVGKTCAAAKTAADRPAGRSRGSPSPGAC